MAAAVERIVVQTTRDEKRAIIAKARRIGLPISELMRRGAAAYQPEQAEAELGQLAEAAKAAAERAASAIDDALAFIDASNERIAALERRTRRRRRRAAP